MRLQRLIWINSGIGSLSLFAIAQSHFVREGRLYRQTESGFEHTHSVMNRNKRQMNNQPNQNKNQSKVIDTNVAEYYVYDFAGPMEG